MGSQRTIRVEVGKGKTKKRKGRAAPERRFGPFSPPDEILDPPKKPDVLWVAKYPLGLRAFTLTSKSDPSNPIDAAPSGAIQVDTTNLQKKKWTGFGFSSTGRQFLSVKKSPAVVGIAYPESTPTGIVEDTLIWQRYSRANVFPNFAASVARLIAVNCSDINSPTVAANYDLMTAFAYPQYSRYGTMAVSTDGRYSYITDMGQREDNIPDIFTARHNLVPYDLINPLAVVQGTPIILSSYARGISPSVALQPMPTLIVDDVLYMSFTEGRTFIGQDEPLFGINASNRFRGYSLANDPMVPELAFDFEISQVVLQEPFNPPPIGQTVSTIRVNKDKTKLVLMADYADGTPSVHGIGSDPFLLLYDISGGLLSPVLLDTLPLLPLRTPFDPFIGNAFFMNNSDMNIVGNFVYVSIDGLPGNSSGDLNVGVYDVSGGTFELVNTLDMQIDGTNIYAINSIVGVSLAKKGEPL